jgi:hypothetical protein
MVMRYPNSWSNTNPCGQFTSKQTPSQAEWLHPDPLCPHNQSFHPGTITVVINDGRGAVVRCAYAGGSADGNKVTCTP